MEYIHFEYSENPLESLEYVRNKCDFTTLCHSNTLYSNGNNFPKGVEVIEPTHPAEFKQEIFETKMESSEDG